MIIVFLLLGLIAYMGIGIVLSSVWVKESIKKHEDDDQWDAFRFVCRCCFKWPAIISNKGNR